VEEAFGRRRTSIGGQGFSYSRGRLRAMPLLNARRLGHHHQMNRMQRRFCLSFPFRAVSVYHERLKTTRDQSPTQRNTMLLFHAAMLFLYAVTLFYSVTLLFLMHPAVGQMILP